MKHILEKTKGDLLDNKIPWYLRVYNDETGEIKLVRAFENKGEYEDAVGGLDE